MSADAWCRCVVIADRKGDFLSRSGIVALMACATGCVGARTNVVANDAVYPISLSRAVRDADGAVVAQEQAVKVGTFHHDATAWGLFFTAIRLNPRTDISEAVNAQVKRAGGVAIVNLRIMGRVCALDYVGVVFAPLLFPGCTKLVVEGDIIKVKGEAAAAPPVAASGARVHAMSAVQ